MGKRKYIYPEVKGWWVYSIKVPSNGKFYIGVSKRKKCCDRWKKCQYKNMALNQYLDEWESMTKTVLVDNLSKEDAYIYEGKIIDALSMNNLCINSKRSGLIKVSDANAYKRELLKNNPEYHERCKQQQKQYNNQRYKNDTEFREHRKQRSKQYYENNKEKISERRKQRYYKKKLEKQQQQDAVID